MFTLSLQCTYGTKFAKKCDVHVSCVLINGSIVLVN